MSSEHPFILYDLDNLQLLLDINNLFLLSKEIDNLFFVIDIFNNINQIISVQSVEKFFSFLIK
jgi:hypothetical protein